MMPPMGDNTCEQCSKKIQTNELFVVYKLVVITNTQYHFVNLLRIIDELNDFVLEKGLHLSSSQIILLRPDILKMFLNKKFFPEEVVFWFLCESEICSECYSKYKVTVPER